MLKMKFAYKGKLYKIAQLGMALGALGVGHGLSQNVINSTAKGRFGLEDVLIIGGALLSAGSIAYREICRVKQAKRMGKFFDDYEHSEN